MTWIIQKFTQLQLEMKKNIQKIGILEKAKPLLSKKIKAEFSENNKGIIDENTKHSKDVNIDSEHRKARTRTTPKTSDDKRQP